MANGEQETGDQIDSSQLKLTPQDVHGPVCHYLSHASPNLDGNGLSFVRVGSEMHARIPVYIFLSKFIFVESYHCSQNWRISVLSGEGLVFPGERQSSGNL